MNRNSEIYSIFVRFKIVKLVLLWAIYACMFAGFDRCYGNGRRFRFIRKITIRGEIILIKLMFVIKHE